MGYGVHLAAYIFKFKEVSYTEILSWCALTATPLTTWEAETMIQISASYDSMKQKAEKVDCLAPYSTDKRTTDDVNKQFDALWGAAE